MLDLLGCRLLAPDTVALITEGRQRRRLEPDEIGHLLGQPGRRIERRTRKVGSGSDPCSSRQNR